MDVEAKDKPESEQDKTASIPTTAPATPRKKKKLWFLLGLMVLLLGMGAAYFFVIRSSSGTPAKPAHRPPTAKTKLVKPAPETQKTQNQLIDSALASIDTTLSEQARIDSTRNSLTPVIENKPAKITTKKWHNKSAETKEITMPKSAGEKNENNSSVEEKSVEDTPKAVSPENKREVGSSNPSMGFEKEKESPITERPVKEDSLKGQQDSTKKIPSTEMVLEPDSRAQDYYEKGVAYQRKNKLDQAVNYYRKALALDPGHQQTRINLASVLMQIGRFQEAKDQLILLYALRPEDQKILFNLGLVLYKLGQYFDAQDKMQQLININPYHLEASLLLASIYEEEGEMKKAVELCRQAHSIDTNDPAALYKLARALDLSGDTIEAAKYYQLYLNSNLEKDVDLASAVRKRLNYILLQKGVK